MNSGWAHSSKPHLRRSLALKQSEDFLLLSPDQFPEDFLNGVTTAVSDFTQVNGNGSVSAGRMFLKRPGRIRLEYDPPNLGLVVVGGGQVAIFDPKSDSEPFRFPLNQTPLSIILQNSVDFKKQDMVREHFADGPTTVLTLQDPTHSDYGFIKLIVVGCCG